MTTSTFKGARSKCSLLGALLLLVYGCGGSEPAGASESTTPSATTESGGEVPPQGMHQPPSQDYESSQANTQPGSEGQPALGPQDASEGAEAGDISAAEIEAFAELQIELAALQQQLSQQAQQASSEAEVQQLQGQLQQQAVQMIEASDLSTQRFDEIATLVQHDPGLQSRVQAVIDQKTGG